MLCQMLSVCADVWFVHCSFAAFALAPGPQCVYSNSRWILSWFQDFAPGVQSIRFCSSIKIPEQQVRQLSLPQAHHIFQDTFRNSRELHCISCLDTLMHSHQWSILWQYGYSNKAVASIERRNARTSMLLALDSSATDGAVKGTSRCCSQPVRSAHVESKHQRHIALPAHPLTNQLSLLMASCSRASGACYSSIAYPPPTALLLKFYRAMLQMAITSSGGERH